ncbi:putative RNA recognition motif domain, nucleotide-binding alpha-beta plait domain superfamily [Helianthus annuus]|nr:putative RNA recognition motif domain, nucleotide-binding alpha-beta plait domain superfamily [Helianthus annuus]
MVKAASSKKQKSAKKLETTTTTKKKITKTPKKKPPSQKPPITSSDSDSDDNNNPSPDQIQKLIQPYTKDQLIDFIVNAALSNPTLYTRIRHAADTDVSHRKIFVYGLGWDTTKETLTQTFKPYGEIEDCNVVIDRVTGKAKGFGFVQFRSRKGALKALKEPRKKINNRTASCQLASLGPVNSGSGSTDNSNRKIYVSNVKPDVDPERLRLFFSKFGEIETGPLGFDSLTGKSRGFALFVYKNVEGFRKALEEPYKVFEGHQLHCQKAASEGKNKGVAKAAVSGPVPVVQQANTPMMAAVASGQNLALLNQAQLGLNPMYGGLFAANPFYASGVLGQVGGVGGAPGGLGSYYGGASGGLNVGVGNASLLGEYGRGVSPVLPGGGLQSAYPKKKGGPATPPALGSASGSRSQGAGGSFSDELQLPLRLVFTQNRRICVNDISILSVAWSYLWYFKRLSWVNFSFFANFLIVILDILLYFNVWS